MSSLVYEPVSKENIEEVVKLAHVAFPEDALVDDSPGHALRASLDPEKYSNFWQKHSLNTLEYIAVYDGSHNLVGTTGFYTENGNTETVYLGWFCVDPSQRGKGYGRNILEWTILQAKEKGFLYLGLYTSDDPNEKTAQSLYDKLGFKIVGEEADADPRYKRLFRELSLS